MSEVGNFVVLVHTADEYTDLERGDVGIIRYIDALGTVHVKWITKPSSLGLVPGEDEWTEHTTGEVLARMLERDGLLEYKPGEKLYTTEEVKRELGIE